MSHKQKTTAEEKIRVVRACLSGELANGKLHSKPKYPQERLGTGIIEVYLQTFIHTSFHGGSPNLIDFFLGQNLLKE